MTLSLNELRPCLEGVIPAMMATCASDGTPNVAYISQVFYVDESHVALSFQFFNKTRQNILANPRATVLLLHPVIAQFYRLHLRYLRTEACGPVFESMKAQLAGIASHSGMDGVFHLRGSDIYEVLEIERIEGQPLPAPPPRCGLVGALRRGSVRLAQCVTLDALLDTALDVLEQDMGVPHAMVLMLDPVSQRLYTVASRGYAASGVGSEIALGEGVVGVAARERTPVRIMHMTSAHLYSQAMRNSLPAGVSGVPPGTDIPYPGLSAPQSQLAVPIVSAGQLLGVLFVESPRELRFSFEDEDVLVALAGQLGAAIDLMQASTESVETPAPGGPVAVRSAQPPQGPAMRVRHYRINDSVFIDDAYLIKGVAGAILWKLLRDHQERGRQVFANRELRLDPALRLPDLADNLEARLLLLQRRLREQCPALCIEKTGRGRFRFDVLRPVELVEVAA